MQSEKESKTEKIMGGEEYRQISSAELFKNIS